MPQIIVVADARAERADSAVMFTERVTVRDFESRHFQNQLVERLGWAVGDADAAERSQPPDDPGVDWVAQERPAEPREAEEQPAQEQPAQEQRAQQRDAEEQDAHGPIHELERRFSDPQPVS